MRTPASATFTILTILAAGCLASCTSAPIVSVTPIDDGSFKTTVRAETEQLALDSAAKSARETCRALERQHVVIDSQTHSLGLPGRTEDPTQQAVELARYASATTFPSLSATDDFEARVQFKCVNYPIQASALGSL